MVGSPPNFVISSFSGLIMSAGCFGHVCMFVSFCVVLVVINFVIRLTFPLLSISNFALSVRITSIVAGSSSSSRISSSRVLTTLILHFNVIFLQIDLNLLKSCCNIFLMLFLHLFSLLEPCCL